MGQLGPRHVVFQQRIGPGNDHALEPTHEVCDFGREAGTETYTRAGRHDRAEPLLQQDAKLAREDAGADSPHYAGRLSALGLNLLRQQKWADAESVLRESLAIREAKQADAWTTFNTRSMLGGALLGQKKYADAEPLLVSGARGLVASVANLSPEHRRLMLAAVQRAVEFYEARDRPDDAAHWRRELEALQHGGKKARDEKMK